MMKTRIALAGALIALSTAAAAAAPNIIVIMTDDQDDMGSLDTMPETSLLLKKRGVTFTNSFVNYPQCTPSRASFLTGQAAHNHGVVSNREDHGGGYVNFRPREANSLAPWLKTAGYTTGMIGKYFGDWSHVQPLVVPPGWDYWAASTNALKSYNYDLFENGVLKHYGTAPDDYKTDVLARHAAGFIATAQQPFFLWIGANAPHSPVKPALRHAGTLSHLTLPASPNFNEAEISDKPEAIRSKPLLTESDIAVLGEQHRQRREMLLGVDEMVRTIATALRRAGRLDDTYIVFTSDNGWSEGSHRWVGKGVVYEESIRVPLIIRGPGIRRGLVRPELVYNLDLTATILDWAGAQPGNPLDGRSLRPLLASGSAPWRSAIPVHREIRPRSQVVFGVRTATRLYAETVTDSVLEQEYYDLASDPYELESLPNPPDGLKNLLGQLRNCAGSQCWIDSPPVQAKPSQRGVPPVRSRGGVHASP